MFQITPTHYNLELQVRELISQATGFSSDRIIQGNQPAPSTLNTYFSLQYIADTPQGLASVKYDPIDGNEEALQYTIKGTRIYTYRLQCIRGDRATLIPLDYLKSFILYTRTFKGRQFFNRSNFLIDNINEINLADAVISNAFELRSALDMTLKVAEVGQLIVPVFNEISLTAQYDYGTLLEEINTIILD